MFPGARKIIFAIQRKVTDDNVRGEVNPWSPTALKTPGYYVVRCMMSLGSALGRLQFSDQLKPDLVIAAGGRPQRPAHHNGLCSWPKFALSIGLGVAQTLENGDIVKLG